MATIFAAVIFDPSVAEGIEGKLIVDTDRERLQAAAAQEVDELNDFYGSELGPFDWDEATYYPSTRPAAESFAWARSYELTPGQVVQFTEFQ